MKVLLLGVGKQGKATLYDLAHSRDVTEIIAADRDFEQLEAYVKRRELGMKVRCEHFDASSVDSLNRLMEKVPDVVIDVLPTSCHLMVTEAAVRYGIHLVNTSYAIPQIQQLSDRARVKEVTVLPEFGMDPGIDLVLMGEAVRAFDSVEEIVTYGAGFPEPQAVDNPLKYKVTWTFDGVLKSYRRAGRVIRDGAVIDIPATGMFSPGHIHKIEIEPLGKLEAFPNGDALKLVPLLGIDRSALRTLGRYVLRWPGHCAFWKTLVDLHFLDDEPVIVDGTSVDRKRFLAALIEPHIQYGSAERDVVVVRVDVTGTENGQRKRIRYQIVDRRDLETGFTAMSRTVGFTASIGAQMIGTGKITRRGVLSPVTDIPFEAFTRELGTRGITVTVEKNDFR